MVQQRVSRLTGDGHDQHEAVLRPVPDRPRHRPGRVAEGPESAAVRAVTDPEREGAHPMHLQPAENGNPALTKMTIRPAVG